MIGRSLFCVCNLLQDELLKSYLTRNPHAIASIKPRDAAQPQSVRTTEGVNRMETAIKNGHNFATGLPIDVIFGSRVGFSGTAELMVQLSNFKNPRWRYTRTALARNLCVSWAFLFLLDVFPITTVYPIHFTYLARHNFSNENYIHCKHYKKILCLDC